VKKLLSALVVAGFLVSLGCGSETGGTKDKDKKGGAAPAPSGGAGAPAKDKDKKGGD
jgi:hypothetical protein